MNNSRLGEGNSMRMNKILQNAITGMGGQVLNFFLQFLGRTVFIYTLGKEYLGISSLLSNVLNVLSISELGIGAAIIFHMYEPLAKNEKEKVKTLVHFYKKAYFVIGLVVLVLGLTMLPFLRYLLKGKTDLVDINIVFLFYVFQSVFSYWFYAYKSAVLRADQKQYIANIITYVANILGLVVQILVLILFHSFELYIGCGIATTVLGNFLVARKVDCLYPYINEKSAPMDKESKKNIFKSVFGTSVYRINSVILLQTDNILISSFVGVVMVGMYENYHLISAAIITVSSVILNSMQSSIGNQFVTEDIYANEKTFRTLCFLAYWFFGWCSICLWTLYDSFITLWIGQEYILQKATVFIIVLDFMLNGFQKISILYKDACGLFWQGRFRPVATVILNLGISLVLVRDLGVVGVLMGTVVSRLLTTWWFEPWMVYKNVFHQSCRNYFCRYLLAVFLVVVIGAAVHFLCIPFTQNSISCFLIKSFICVFIPNLFMLLFWKTEEFQYFAVLIRDVMKQRLAKRKKQNM